MSRLYLPISLRPFGLPILPLIMKSLSPIDESVEFRPISGHQFSQVGESYGLSI